MVGVSVATGGAVADQGNQGATPVDGKTEAAFGKALSQAKRDDDQQAATGQQNVKTTDDQAQGHDDATCTVEVRTKEIGATGNIARHAYVVTTEHSSRDEGDSYRGKETVHRGGPESRVQEPADGTRMGDIITNSEVFKKDGLDHPGDGATRPSVPVGIYDGNCDDIDKSLEAAGAQIEQEGHDYWPLSQNSNSAASEMLDRAGLPVPDDPWGWTPGWKTDLPEGDLVKGPIN